VLVNQAQALQSLGRSEEALRVLDEVAAAGVAADANAGLLPFLLHHTRAAALVALGRYADAETEARLALDIAMASDPRLAAEAYATLGAIAARTGDDGSAAEHLAVARTCTNCPARRTTTPTTSGSWAGSPPGPAGSTRPRSGSHVRRPPTSGRGRWSRSPSAG
jgi:hypothetical protein